MAMRFLNFFLIIGLIVSCAKTKIIKIGGGIDVPEDKKLNVSEIAEVNFKLKRSRATSLLGKMRAEGKNLSYSTIHSYKLDREIKILSDRPVSYFNDRGLEYFEMKFGDRRKITCFISEKNNLSFWLDQSLKSLMSSKEYKSYHSSGSATKTSSGNKMYYDEVVMVRRNNNISSYYDQFKVRRVEFSKPAGGNVQSLACFSYGVGFRNTLKRIISELELQVMGQNLAQN